MAKINDEYDIGAAFEAIENELISSMIRNFENHKQKELDEKKHWSMWQTEMLKSLEKYKHDNQKKYGKQFKDINKQIEVLIRLARSEGGMNQEKRILEEIKKGFPAKRISKGGTAEFFEVNDRKLDALIQATTSDMQKAETAVLRMANDQYRKIIYNAQVYANTGAGTYEKAVDMATKDFLSTGLNCIQYTNGARHTIADYADMAIRTASKRAYLQGEGEMRQQWGLHLVIMNKRGSPCPKCLPFVGKILIDDVWSGGSRKDGKYPLMSSAIAAGLYHPRCKDSHTTYFPGITTVDPKYNKQEISNLEDQAQQEARQQYAERQEKRFGRLAEFSLDPENQQRYEHKQKEWHKQGEKIPEQVEKVITDAKNRAGMKSIAKPVSDDIIKISKDRTVYEGIPKNWKTLKSKEITLQSVNPKYATGDIAYRANCPNCVSAYEMRKRGYDVTAKPAGKNHYLNRNPEAAWVDPDVRKATGSGKNDILKSFKEWPDDSRAEITVVWKDSNKGHVIVAEKVKGDVLLYDVQSGNSLSEDFWEWVEEERTLYWRIDNIEPSDRGITACERGDIYEV